VSFPIRDGDRELFRVEVLDVKPNGEAKFRLWYYKWRETRPHQPYVDVEITYKGKEQGFIGRVYTSETKGILREHLAEIARLLEEKGVKGVAYYEYDYEKRAFLQFTGAFRDSVLRELGIRPELPPGEPPAVQYLGGLRFKIGDREAEFGDGLYAKLEFPSRDEAEHFAASLKAVGVDAEIVGNVVRLDSDSFFGLLAATNAVPPGLTPLYRSNDLQVYAAVEGDRMRFYFAVKHGDAWRVAKGLSVEAKVQLVRAERDILEAIRDAVARALAQLGRPAEVGEPKEDRDEKGNVKGYYLYLYGPHLAAFLEHATERVEAKLAVVRLEGKRIVVKAGDAKAEVEFKLLKRKEAEYLVAQDVEQTLALYKSLKALGVPVEITPEGVKVDSEALWTLVAVTVERGTPGKLPAEVMPGVELLKVYNVGGVEMYIFRAEGLHYYFAVKTGEGWRAAGGKKSGRHVLIFGEAAPTIAEAINAIYRERGVERRIEVKYDKRKGTPYIYLTNVDLELFDVR